MKTSCPDNEEFFSLGFYVDKRVLTPRNETEIMVYQVLKEEFDDFILIDVGTGSSCIIVSILKNLKKPPLKAYALDISKDALDVAKINIKKHNLQDKIRLLRSDLLEVFLNKSFSLNAGKIVLTANLPYVKNGDINLDKNVLLNDPSVAIFGGEETGFELYEKLIFQILKLKEMYKTEVVLFMEIGFDQYDHSKEFLSKLGLRFEYFKDLNGIWRVIKIYF